MQQPGRIEVYLHSDSYSENKGGALVKVVCDSDAAANTAEFKDFCRYIARLAYADPANLFTTFPVAQERLNELQAKLKEKVAVAQITTMTMSLT